MTTELPFEALRNTALSEDGIEFEIEWQDGKAKLRRRLPPADLLLALHAPIALRGWKDASTGAPASKPSVGDRVAGSWQVPEYLAGFTLDLVTEAAPGRYALEGQPPDAAGGRRRLCSPCRKGRQLQIEAEVTGEWSGDPTVVVANAGFPEARDRPDAPPAVEWLRALGKSDNREYSRLADRYATDPGAAGGPGSAADSGSATEPGSP